ncbi:MAG: hypothetical protein WBQ26_10010 [Gemmatimonadaceae bacterium]
MDLTATGTPPAVARWARLGLLAVLALYGIAYMRDPGGGHLIDGIDLAIHETGHVVFGPFGEVIQFAGGTLFQLIVPATFLVYFLRFAPTRDEFGAAVTLWWMAINLWNIAVYAGDARTQRLPLVGGGEHDWAYLLGRAGWLSYDTRVAALFHALGVVAFVVALWWGFQAARRLPAAAEVDDAGAEQ